MASQTLHAKAIITAVDRVSGPMAQMSRAFASTKGHMAALQRVGSSLTGFGTLATAAITVPMTAAVKGFANFEDALVDAEKVFNGTPEQFEAIKRQINAMALEVPLAKEKIAKLAESAARASIPFKEMGSFMQLAAEFSVAFGVNADEASERLAKLKTALDLSIPELRKMSDAMNVLANNSAASEAELLEVTRRTAALVKAVGGKGAARQLSALAGAMVASGVQAEVAGTAIRNLFIELTGGEEASKSTKQALTNLGLEAKAVAKSMTKDSIGTIVDVFDKLNEKPKELQLSILNNLAGKRAVDALAPLMGNMKELRRQMDLVAKAMESVGSSTRGEFTKSNRRLNAQLSRMANAFANIRDSMVERWLPAMKSAANYLKDFAAAFDSMPNIVKWGADLAVAAAVLGPIALAAGLAAKGIALLAGGIAAIAGAVSVPFVAVAASIALLATGIYESWDKLKVQFKAVWDSIVQTAQGAIELLEGIFTLRGDKMAKGLIDSFKGVLGIFRGLHESFRLIGESITGIIESLTRLDLSKLSSFLPSLADMKKFVGLGDQPATPGMAKAPAKPGGMVRDMAADLGIGALGNIEAKVTEPVRLEGQGQVDVKVRVEGPGQVTGLSAKDDGRNIQLNTGTGMTDVTR